MLSTIHEVENICMKEEKNCGGCTNYTCRCGDCFSLVSNDGEWWCDLAEKPCVDVEECRGYNF